MSTVEERRILIAEAIETLEKEINAEPRQWVNSFQKGQIKAYKKVLAMIAE